tara:strand:+ start:3449 stop:3943 length:495 start_codon:yes stop_codon:yes gene_type:complete
MGACAQSKNDGPIIKGFGEVYEVREPDFILTGNRELKVVFDVYKSGDTPTGLNKSMETAARFLNMHAQNGIPKERMYVAVVVHNEAAKDVLSDTAYQKEYGMDNPNTGLLKALLEADVQVILCGQSAAARGFAKEELQTGTQVALSAMSALLQLDGEGYVILKL